MIKKLIPIMLIFICNFYHCSSSVQIMPEPIDKKNLLIGSLILDINGYQDNFLTSQENIDVAIVGRYVKDGRLKNFGQWTTTDEEGYFYIANVPEGEYAIKGFRIHLMGWDKLIIENELNDPERNYYELRTKDFIGFNGNLFDTSSNQRIVNLKHNIFTLYQNGIVDYKRYDRVQDLKLSTGEILSSPPVPYYFVEKFEGSGWDTYLQLQLR